jgi:hypothetical protein
MNSRICVCCGQVIENRMAFSDPNVCTHCLEEDWAETGAPEQVSFPARRFDVTAQAEMPARQTFLAARSPALPYLEDLNQPSEIEFLEAEIAAKKIIAEAAAKEAKALESRLFALKRSSD